MPFIIIMIGIQFIFCFSEDVIDKWIFRQFCMIKGDNCGEPNKDLFPPTINGHINLDFIQFSLFWY